MRNLFKPFDLNDPDGLFWQVAKCLALAASLMAVVILLAAGWNLMCHEQKISKLQQFPHLNAAEYDRFVKNNKNAVVIIEEQERGEHEQLFGEAK